MFNPISFLFLAIILVYWHCFAAVVINWMPGKGYREQGKWVLRSSEGKNEFCMHYASPTLPLVVVLMTWHLYDKNFMERSWLCHLNNSLILCCPWLLVKQNQKHEDWEVNQTKPKKFPCRPWIWVFIKLIS